MPPYRQLKHQSRPHLHTKISLSVLASFISLFYHLYIFPNSAMPALWPVCRSYIYFSLNGHRGTRISHNIARAPTLEWASTEPLAIRRMTNINNNKFTIFGLFCIVISVIVACTVHTRTLNKQTYGRIINSVYASVFLFFFDDFGMFLYERIAAVAMK